MSRETSQQGWPRWLVQKRVANTPHWSTVATSATRREAIHIARTMPGGASTGTRIISRDPYTSPELITGTDW